MTATPLLTLSVAAAFIPVTAAAEFRETRGGKQIRIATRFSGTDF